MAGKGKVAVRELGENLIRLSRVGDLSGIKDLLDTQEDHEFVAAAINFREQKSGGFALLAAAVDGHKDTMEYLLQKGGKVDLMDKTGETVLMKVAERGTMDLVVFLVEKGADINIPSGVEGITALMKACKKGQMAVVKFLLENGAELNSVDKSGWTALIHAAEKGYAEIVQALVAYHVNLNYVDDESGWTALMYASRYGHTDTVTTLLKAGCTLEIVDRKRNTALLLACFNRHWATAEVLIDHGVDLNAVSDVGDTALMLACLRGSLSTVQKLVAKGADLTLTNKKGLTAKDFAKTLDIQRALVELKKEKEAEVAAATAAAAAIAIEKAKPVDITAHTVLQRLLQQAPTVVGLQGVIHLSEDLSTTWAQTNELIKTVQATFVQQQQSSSSPSTSNDTEQPPPPPQLQQQQQQMAVKYHALMLRLWVEMVTFAAFYTKHHQEIQRLLASTEPPMAPETQTLWSLHFALSTCMAVPGAGQALSPLLPSELKLSQLLALDLLVQRSRDTNATLDSSGGDGALSKSLAQWAAWARSEDVTIRSLLNGLAVRRGEVSSWVDPTTAAGSHHNLVDTVVPRVQAQRRALTNRFYTTAAESESSTGSSGAAYLTERIPQIEQEELEKIVGSVATQQIYASAYTDLSTLLSVLTSTTASPDQLNGDNASPEAIEKLIVDVTGLRKPVPPPVPAPVPPVVEPAPVVNDPPAAAPAAVTTDDKETSNPLHTSVPLTEPQQTPSTSSTTSPSPPPPPPSSSPASSTRPVAKLEVTNTPTPTATTSAPAPAAPATKSSKCGCIIS